MTADRNFRTWGVATALIVVVTLLGAITPAAGSLYRLFYPPNYEKQLMNADLNPKWDHEPLIQYEPAYFTATIIYDKGSGQGNVEISKQNVADLVAEKGEADVDLLTGRNQFLKYAKPLSDGRRQLQWRWKVIPYKAGSLVFRLRIVPIVVTPSGETTLHARNDPVTIKVRVHPNARDLNELKATAEKRLQITMPKKLTAGKRTMITATLPLEAHQDTVQADIALSREEGVQAAIQPVPAPQPKDQVVRQWNLTPDSEGSLGVVFSVDLATDAGDEHLTGRVPVYRSVTVGESISIWERLQAPVLWITPFVVLLATILGIRAALGRRNRDGSGQVAPGGGNDQGAPARE